MTGKSQQSNGRDGDFSSLNTTIDDLNLAKEASSITPAKAVFGSVAILLTMIRVSFFLFYDETLRAHASWDPVASEAGYTKLGLSCADVCRALERGMNGRTSVNLCAM